MLKVARLAINKKDYTFFKICKLFLCRRGSNRNKWSHVSLNFY